MSGPTPTPTPTGVEAVSIDYSYDPLYRLTRAAYSGGFAKTYTYSYDAVGNRLTQNANGALTTYIYDNANRLTSVNGQVYTWDNNGNLVSDGLLTYSYDQANRLKTAVQGANTYTFAYNGVGDRLSQTVGITTTRYALDPAAGLTQVLADGTNTYLYGAGRIAQYQAVMQYFGADGLGSVRQLYDANAQVIANNRYDPYGNVLSQYGTARSVFAFTGEQWDAATGLEYLRARYYSPAQGRFLTRDVWEGDPNAPMSYNAWSYVYGNPVNLMDPSGKYPPEPGEGSTPIQVHEVVRFIVQRMREDSTSKEIQNLNAMNNTHHYEDACASYGAMTWWQRMLVGGQKYLAEALNADIAARNAAMTRFGCLVADGRSRPVCGQWDYKVEIDRYWGNAQSVDFPFGNKERVIFYYDIWTNMHFGYVGRAAGFSEETLLWGAEQEQKVSLPGQTRDDYSDIVAAKIGMQLYRQNTLSESALLWQVYQHRDELNKAIVENGRIIKVYR